MQFQEHVPLGPKTTMKIGGGARWFAELKTKEDAEEAWQFAREKKIPLLVLGAGSNTVFADGEINALIVRITADHVEIEKPETNNQKPVIRAQTGKPLATLINELSAHDLDLSALTGIPGTLGGALFGNAGQGPKGMWLDSFVESVTAFHQGTWKTFTREECGFHYRESVFKEMPGVILWEMTLRLPSRPQEEIKADVETLLKKRIETQPHRLTAGSCFKAIDGTPAWKFIEAAELKGFTVGGVQISGKHANFLLNVGKGTFEDMTQLLRAVREKVPELQGIEMRLFGEDGEIIQI